MDQTATTNLTLTEAESQVMRSILTPLRPIMREAMPSQTWTEDELFFNIALPLLMHLRMSLTQLILRATLLCTGFFHERESYTANLSRLWPATNWPLHVRATSTGSTGDSPFVPSST